MEIYSVDSTESRENKKNPVAKYDLLLGWNPGSSAIPVNNITPDLIPHLLISLSHLDPFFSNALLTPTESFQSKNQ